MLEEEISEDILDQIEATNISKKKLGKTANKLSRKLNERNMKKKEQKMARSSGTNLDWPEECRNTARMMEVDLEDA